MFNERMFVFVPLSIGISYKEKRAHKIRAPFRYNNNENHE